MNASRLLIGALALSALSALGCRGTTSKESPIVGIRNMYDQPKYDIQEESSFFPDHRTMRPLVEGVVSREEDTDPGIAAGRLEDESGYVLEIPREVVTRFGNSEALVARGKARYGIYCVPCHDATGNGEGLVKRRAVAGGAAAFVPPTFHQDRLRHMPDGQLFATISNGKSNMPAYAAQIPVNDRWAIVAYVRALQIAGPKLASLPGVAPTTVSTTMPPPGGPTATATATASGAPATSGAASASAPVGSASASGSAPVAPASAAPSAHPTEKHP